MDTTSQVLPADETDHSSDARSQRYNLTQQQVRRLSRFERPVVDPQTGRTKLVANPDEAPYRIMLGTGATIIPGFGVYVGRTATTYEVRTKDKQGKGVRERIGPVQLHTMEEAMRKALEVRERIAAGKDSHRRAEKLSSRAQEVRNYTVDQCLGIYIQHLGELLANGKVKPSSVASVRNSRERLHRDFVMKSGDEPGKMTSVALASILIRDLDAATVVAAWNGCRLSSMLRSNLLSPHQQMALEQAGAWWKLKSEQIVALGFKGKSVQRAKSAGMAATEHTFGDARRAVDLVIKKEYTEAVLSRRQPEMLINPFAVLAEQGHFRDHQQMRAHARRAQIRNPLGAAGEDNSLQTAMKALMERRDKYNDPSHKVGVDYLMLILLWGTRRNEATGLRWYKDCTPEQLLHEDVSWVWLAERAEEHNPTTGKPGSQVFLHDPKSGVVQIFPVCYFAERILRWRWDDRMDIVENSDAVVAKAKEDLQAAQRRTIDEVKLAPYRKAVRRAEFRVANLGWVFPARSVKARDGHYSDAKSLLSYLRTETGRLDLTKDVDIGLTVHDFRRTFGRFADKMISGRMTSELLRHFPKSGAKDDQMADVTGRYYTDQEWADVRVAMATVEESIIRTSPRVWNRLKGPDKPVLDEANDPPVIISWSLRGTKETE